MLNLVVGRSNSYITEVKGGIHLLGHSRPILVDQFESPSIPKFMCNFHGAH